MMKIPDPAARYRRYEYNLSTLGRYLGLRGVPVDIHIDRTVYPPTVSLIVDIEAKEQPYVRISSRVTPADPSERCQEFHPEFDDEGSGFGCVMGKDHSGRHYNEDVGMWE